MKETNLSQVVTTFGDKAKYNRSGVTRVNVWLSLAKQSIPVMTAQTAVTAQTASEGSFSPTLVRKRRLYVRSIEWFSDSFVSHICWDIEWRLPSLLRLAISRKQCRALIRTQRRPTRPATCKSHRSWSRTWSTRRLGIWRRERFAKLQSLPSLTPFHTS